MKTKNKTLVYDDACPMCAWYTSAFVKTGLLPEEGRKPFSEASPELLHHINWQRSKNEIPLIDNETNRVVYGIDALLEIIGQRCPILKATGHLKPVNWLLKKVYNFISYNRKVIVAQNTNPGKIDCTPDFNIPYRVLFMALFLLFNTAMLFPVHNHLLTHIPFYKLSLMELQVAHFVLVGINITLACTLKRKKAMEYLGQVNMLALLTILFLLPLVLVNKNIDPGNWFNISYLVLLTLFILKEYSRRMVYAGLTEQHRMIITINLFSLAAFTACLFIL